MFPEDFADQRRSLISTCESQSYQREILKLLILIIFLTIFTMILRKVANCLVAAYK
jgi:hypothetical protein